MIMKISTGLIIFLLLLGSAPHPSFAQEDQFGEIKKEPAKLLAQTINNLNLREIDPNSVTNPQDIIHQMNLMLDRVNELGFDFSHIEATNEQVAEVEGLIPLIGPYNDLIRAAEEFDEDDPDTVNEVYVAALTFAGDTVLWKGKLAFRFAWKATGVLTDLFQLKRLNTLCGWTCVKVVMSKLHWYLRNYATDLLKEWQTVEDVVYAGEVVIETTRNVTENAKERVNALCVVNVVTSSSEAATAEIAPA